MDKNSLEGISIHIDATQGCRGQLSDLLSSLIEYRGVAPSAKDADHAKFSLSAGICLSTMLSIMLYGGQVRRAHGVQGSPSEDALLHGGAANDPAEWRPNRLLYMPSYFSSISACGATCGLSLRAMRMGCSDGTSSAPLSSCASRRGQC